MLRTNAITFTYGINEKGILSEEDFGYMDPVKVRSSYPESKRMCECLCRSYAEEYHVPFKIARLTQTFGAGVERNDRRVFPLTLDSIVSTGCSTKKRESVTPAPWII